MPQEFQTLVVSLAYKRDNTLAQSPAFAQWAKDNVSAFKR
jgi:hypothetical protein